MVVNMIYGTKYPYIAFWVKIVRFSIKGTVV